MNFLYQLKGVKQKSAGKWVALCPVHDEKTPSLHITQKDDKVLMHCFGCGANGEDVLRAINADLAELGGERSSLVPAKIRDQYDDDCWFIAIYESDVKKGLKPTYKDNRRYNLAINRKKGIERKWGNKIK